MNKKDGNTIPSFAELLGKEIDNIKKDKTFISEAEIAKSAGIDPTIFSQLKNPKNERAIKNLNYRLQLATVMRKNFEDIFSLAQEFVQATPKLEIEDKNLKEKIKILTVGLLQNEINKVEIGLPLFFDTAPFLIAEKYGYFKKLKLNVKLDYVKWAKTLEYLNLDSSDDNGTNTINGLEDLDTFETPDLHDEKNEIRLVIYNRESILTENKQETSAFCFPIGIYNRKNFVLWGKSDLGKSSPDKKTWKDKLKALAEKGIDARIIVSGEDMKLGVKKAFKEAGVILKDECFIVFDQFDGAEAFLNAHFGDAWVGGVPQRIIAERKNVEVLVGGEEINLPNQYNGIVCRKKDLDSKSKRNVVIQILWAWYQAVTRINHSPQTEADYIVQKMNIYAGQLKYDSEDFIDFWKDRKTKFILPASPQEMLREIQSSEDYSYRLYDWTNYFADSFKNIEKVFITNGNKELHYSQGDVK